jgi:flagellar biosynthesis protein FliQ
MSPDQVLDIIKQTLMLAAMIAMPMLGTGMVVGLLIAVFQAATQIQESSLNFLPKLGVIGGVAALAGPWMLDKVVGFTVLMFENVAYIAPQGSL